MPELPEVETVRRGLQPAMDGKRIVRVETRRGDLRFPFPEKFVQRLQGARVSQLGRRAKYLVAHLSSGEALIKPLGMTGRFTIDRATPGQFHHKTGDDAKHDHVVFDMEDGPTITFNDARRFGFMDLWADAALDAYPAFAALGPEPTDPGAVSGVYLEEAFAGRKAPVKAALMDQSVIAGLGNIYVCEALHLARISPLRASGSIRRPRLDALAAAIHAVIAEAIEAGGSTISDFGAPDGGSGYFQHRFQVYDRVCEPCRRCGRPIRRIVQSGRSTFYCATCQR